MQKAQKGIRKGKSMFDVQVKPTAVTACSGKVAVRKSDSRRSSDRLQGASDRTRLVWQHDRGRRSLRNGIAFEVLIATIVGGNRLSILVALAHGPMCVGAIQELLGAPSPSHVSEELQRLQEMGLVTWDLDKTKHVYRLTHRLRVFEEDGAVQLIVIAEAGHWALLHVDEGSGTGRIVEPPTCFLDASRFDAALRRDALAAPPGRSESGTDDRRRKHADPSPLSSKSRRRYAG